MDGPAIARVVVAGAVEGKDDDDDEAAEDWSPASKGRRRMLAVPMRLEVLLLPEVLMTVEALLFPELLLLLLLMRLRSRDRSPALLKANLITLLKLRRSS